MEYTIDYKYGRGTLKELSEGNVELNDFNSSAVRDIFELEGLENKLVIVPWAVGIYQSGENNTESYEEREEVDGFTNVMSDLSSFLTRIQLRGLTGKDDGVHEDLIHVVYDTNLFVNGGMMREYLQDDMGRISFSPYTHFPDFNDQSSKDLPNKGKKAINELELLKSKRASIEELKSVLGRLKEDFLKQKESYGLTRSEYSFLGMLQLAINESPRNKLIMPGDFPSFPF